VGGSGGGEKTVFVINYQYDVKKAYKDILLQFQDVQLTGFINLTGSIQSVGSEFRMSG